MLIINLSDNILNNSNKIFHNLNNLMIDPEKSATEGRWIMTSYVIVALRATKIQIEIETKAESYLGDPKNLLPRHLLFKEEEVFL